MHSIRFSNTHNHEEVGQAAGMGAAHSVAAMFAGMFVVAFFAPLFGWLLQFLWNQTVAAMFELKPISYWQAVGLFILAKLVFGIGGGGGGHADHQHKWHKHAKQAAPTQSADVTEAADDAMLQKYWQEEGKAAYEAYAAARKTGTTSPEEKDR